MSTKDKLIASAQKNLEKGQIVKAVNDYQQLVDLEPRVIQHRQKLADLQSRAKLTADAVTNYEIVAKHFAENGFFLKAIAVYKQIQKLDPDKTECYLRLAELNEKQGLMGNALAEYRNLATYYERKNLLSEAAGILQKIKTLEPDNLNVRVKIADCLVRAGFREKGKAEFRELFDTIGVDADPAMALRLYEVFVPIFPNDAEVQGGMARLLSSRGEHERAKTLLGGLVKQSPNDPDLLEALAEIQRAAGEVDNERLTLAHLLKKDPERSAARLRLATIFATEGQGERALQEIGEYRQTLIVAGLEEPLLALYRQLVRLLPRDPRIIEVLREAGDELAVQAEPVVALAEESAPETVAVKAELSVAPPQLATDVAGAVAEPTKETAERPVAGEGPAAPAEEISLNFLEEFGEIGEPPQESVVAAPAVAPPPLPEVIEAGSEELELDLGEFDLDFGGSPAEVVDEPAELTAPEVAAVPAVAAMPLLAEETPALPAGDGEDVEVAVDFSLDALPDFAEFAESEPELLAIKEDFAQPDGVAELLEDSPLMAAEEESPSLQSSADEGLPDFPALTELADLAETVSEEVSAPPLATEVEWLAGAGVEEGSEELEELAEEIEELAEEVEPVVEELEPIAEELVLEELLLDEPLVAEPLLEELSEELLLEEALAEDDGGGAGLESAVEELEELSEADELLSEELETPIATGNAAQGVTADSLIVVPAPPLAEEEFDVAAEFADLAELTNDTLESRDLGLDDDLELLSGAMLELLPDQTAATEPIVEGHLVDEETDEPLDSLELLPLPESDAGTALHLPDGFAAVTGEAGTVIDLDAELEEADFYLHQGLAEEAEAVCQRVLSHKPGYQPAQQRLDEAAALRREALRVAALAQPAGQAFVDLSADLFDESVVAGIDAGLDGHVQLDGVLSAFKEGVSAQIDKEDTESHYNLGIAYKEMGLLDDAIAEFDRAKVDPARHVDCLTLKGMCLVEKGDLTQAETVLLEGTTQLSLVDSDRIGLLYELGLLYEMWERPQDALESFRKVAAVDHFFRDVGTKVDQLSKLVGGEVKSESNGDAIAPVRRNRVSFV